MTSAPLTVLLLAGQREGRPDPFADSMGETFKCLIPVAGRSMILHIVETLAETPQVGEILVSANDAAPLKALEPVRSLIAAGRLTIVQARSNLVDSVVQALAGRRYPVLVTTADNVLLSADSIAELHEGAQAARADVAVAFARQGAVLAAHPDGQRRFYRFSDDAFSNCNAYWLGSPAALGPAEVFRQGGQFAKHPGRIVQAFGLINLIRFRYGIGTLDAAFRRFSRRFRLIMRPVILSDGAAAIDVDNARTLGVVEDILHRRTAFPLAVQ